MFCFLFMMFPCQKWWRNDMSVFLQIICILQICNLQVYCQLFSMTKLKDVVISIIDFLSYHCTVVLYIIHIWCYPLISHDYSTQNNNQLNVFSSPSSYSNIFSIIPSYDCIHFLYHLLLSLDARNHYCTNIIYFQ